MKIKPTRQHILYTAILTDMILAKKQELNLFKNTVQTEFKSYH